MKLLRPKQKRRTHGEEIVYRRENLSLKHDLKYYHGYYFARGIPKRMNRKKALAYYTQKINNTMGWSTALKHLHQANNNSFEPSAA